MKAPHGDGRDQAPGGSAKEGSPASGGAAGEVALRSDVDQALRFCHAVEAQTRLRVAEGAVNVQALVQTLLVQGVISTEEFERQRVVAVERERVRAGREMFLILGDDQDKYALESLPEIDCAARIPLCEARCCTLGYPLTVQDLDEGVLRWDYARPYVLRQGPDGYCVHQGTDHACTVHAQRPAACRRYDCRGDERIWIDFDRRLPAP